MTFNYFSWKKDDVTKTLSPVMVPDDTKPASDAVLQSTKYNCDGKQQSIKASFNNMAISYL